MQTLPGYLALAAGPAAERGRSLPGSDGLGQTGAGSGAGQGQRERGTARRLPGAVIIYCHFVLVPFRSSNGAARSGTGRLGAAGAAQSGDRWSVFARKPGVI